MDARASPSRKPLSASARSDPNFKTLWEEEAFWQSHEFEDGPATDWQELEYEPQATRRPRTHVYRVRLDDQEMAKLQALAKGRGVPASVVLRDLVRQASSSPRR